MGRVFGIGRFLSVTSWLIILNVFIFFAFLIASVWWPNLISYFALKPSQVIEQGAVWLLLTSMFLHAGGVHLFVNMFTLFFLGGLCERIIGWKRVLGLYLVAGLFGGLAFVGFAYLGTLFPFGDRVFGGVDELAVGASGALFGLLGILAVLIPTYRVMLVAGPILVIILQIILGAMPLPSPLVTTLSMLLSILLIVMLVGVFYPSKLLRKIAVMIAMPLWAAPIAAIAPLVIVSLFVKLPIGNSAHFGGLIVGLIYGFVLLFKYPKKVALLRRAFRRFS